MPEPSRSCISPGAGGPEVVQGTVRTLTNISTTGKAARGDARQRASLMNYRVAVSQRGHGPSSARLGSSPCSRKRLPR